MTDDEIFMGTIRITNLDGNNRPVVKAAVESVHNAQRGYWVLCQALVRNGVRNGSTDVVLKCCYIVFRDCNTVIFYS